MFPDSFTTIEFFQKKKNIILYKTSDSVHQYILKAIISEDLCSKQAFYDEYCALHEMNHPMIPKYYWLKEHYTVSDETSLPLVLCMEYCEGIPLSEYKNISYDSLKIILRNLGSVLLDLLHAGILYTDLNPSNVLVYSQNNTLNIHLLDYTYCYYFKKNPHPDYPIRFSYDLSPDLKAQQLLIQELAQLSAHLMENSSMPSEFYVWLETGLHPSPDLYFHDYISMLNSRTP